MFHFVVNDIQSLYHKGDADTHMASYIENHSILLHKVIHNSIQNFHLCNLEMKRFLLDMNPVDV